MATKRFQELRVYVLAEGIADLIWQVAKGWDHFAMDTVGKQIVRAADSIGANIAEGNGRHSYADNRRFVQIARGSLYETQHWLRRAYKRGLLDTEQVGKLKLLLDELGPKLNAYRNSLTRKLVQHNPTQVEPKAKSLITNNQ